MRTILIPSSMSTKDANMIINTVRRMESDEKRMERAINKNFYIYMSFLTIMIHLFIFNTVHNYIFGDVLWMYLYGIFTVIETIVLIINLYLVDYRYTSTKILIITGFLIFVLIVIMIIRFIIRLS